MTLRILQKRLGQYIGITKHTEALLFCIVGIISTIFDTSLFKFNVNLNEVWEFRLDPGKFSDQTELCMKYVLTFVIVIRTFTVHLYLGCYIVLLYPVFFEDRPGLMIPWMLVSSIKCLFMGLISFTSGLYICVMYKFLKTTCFEFILLQAVHEFPSFYMFGLILGYYKDLKQMQQVRKYMEPVELRARRTRAKRSNIITSPDRYDDNRRILSVSTIENMVTHLSNGRPVKVSRSLDTMLSLLKREEARNEILRVKDDPNDDIVAAKKITSSKKKYLKSHSLSEILPRDIDDDLKRVELLERTEPPMRTAVDPNDSEHVLRTIYPDAGSEVAHTSNQNSSSVQNTNSGGKIKKSMLTRPPTVKAQDLLTSTSKMEGYGLQTTQGVKEENEDAPVSNRTDARKLEADGYVVLEKDDKDKSNDIE